jgi:hypothetical protein
MIGLDGANMPWLEVRLLQISTILERRFKLDERETRQVFLSGGIGTAQVLF